MMPSPPGRPGARVGPAAAGYRIRGVRVGHPTGAIARKGNPVDSSDPYSVLRLGPEATAEEISRAYRSQLRLHHPDTRPVPGSAEQERMEQSRLQSAMDAYAVLGNPAPRSLYDREHRRDNTAPDLKARVRFRAAHNQQVVVGPLKWTPPRGGGVA